MIGSSVVPGLPNRCVTPSSLSSARNAERPVMRFMKVLPFPKAVTVGILGIMADPGPRDQGSAVMAALHHRTRLRDARSEQPLVIDVLLPFRALPHHAGK